jgi:hypothetical protein
VRYYLPLLPVRERLAAVLPFELERLGAVERVVVLFGFAAVERLPPPLLAFAAAVERLRLAGLDAVERLRDGEDDDDLERDDEAAAVCGLRSLAGISAVTTALASRGIMPSRNLAIRCSSRRIVLASLMVSLSPRASARVWIAV